MLSVVTIYLTLFIVGTLFLYMLKLVTDEISNIIDKKFIEFANQINKLEKENIKLNNDLKILNKNSSSKNLNTKSSLPVIYGCFH
jgi:hypothetical protein